MEAARAVPLRILSVALALLAAGCSAGGSGGEGPVPPASNQAARFRDCQELRQYLRDTVASAAELGALAGDASGGAGSGGVAVPTAASADAPAAEASGERDFSHTNVQEQGVDEPDFVKTDGDHLYVLAGGQLLIFDAWPPAEARELARVAIEGDPAALFVRGTTVLVLSRVWADGTRPPVAGSKSWSFVVATLVGTADKAAPAVLRELAFEGEYLDARLVGGRAYLVVSTRRWGVGLGAPAETDPAGPADLLPRFSDSGSGSGSPPVIDAVCPCEDAYRPPVPNGSGFVSVVAVDLDDPLAEPAGASVLSDWGTVYASQDRLYLATPNQGPWVWLPVAAQAAEAPRSTTGIHEFRLGAQPAYLGSGEVPGWVLNSFSMSEHQGRLRVATTEEDWTGGRGPANGVYVLESGADGLREVGKVTGLGKPGERIYAVRFLGDRGFVVTFRQTDPLYGLDLSDPANPRVAGELEVPGFSTYLHPLGADRLLAVGQNTETRGVDLSLFDVADLAQPRLVQRLNVGAGSSSEAQYEHRAFTYFAPLGVLALPVTTWSGTPWADSAGTAQVFSGAHLYAVDPDAGFTLRGRIDHASFYRDGGQPFWYYPEPVRRTLFVGEAGGSYFAYTVSGGGLKISAWGDLSEVAAFPLPSPPQPWGVPAVPPLGGGAPGVALRGL